MDVSKKINAVKGYLRAINRETQHCEVKFIDDEASNGVDCVRFEIRLKSDPFYQHGIISISEKFEFINQLLFCKFFGLMPTYNNDHTVFWTYKPEYK